MIIHDNTNLIWWSSIIFALIGIGWFHWFCFLWDDVSWMTMFGIGQKQTHFLGAYHLLHSQSWIMNPNLQVYYSVRSVRFWDGSVFFLQIWGAVAGEDCVGSARFRRRCRCCQRGETWRKFPDCCSNPVAFRGGVACVLGDSKSAFARKPIRRRLFKQFDSRTFSFQKSVELCWILMNSI